MTSVHYIVRSLEERERQRGKEDIGDRDGVFENKKRKEREKRKKISQTRRKRMKTEECREREKSWVIHSSGGFTDSTRIQHCLYTVIKVTEQAGRRWTKEK